MAQIQVHLPEDVNRWLNIQKAVNEIKTKEEVIINSLRKLMKE
jgi:hypothetical protein